MKRLFSVLMMSMLSGVPAFAADMQCSAFMAMDSAGQMAAMQDSMAADGAMAEGAMADGAMATDATKTEGAMAEGAMAEGAMTDGMSPEETMKAMVAACTAHPDMMVMDAMGAMQ